MKTSVMLLQDNPESLIKAWDIGYIDGYIRGADDRPYAVVVIPDKGLIDMCSLTILKSIGIEPTL